jgi:hypothetical protein
MEILDGLYAQADQNVQKLFLSVHLCMCLNVRVHSSKKPLDWMNL